MYVAIRDFTVLWLGYKNVIEGVKDLGLKSFELNVSKDLKPESYRDMGITFQLGFDLSTEASIRTVVEMLESESVQVCALLVSNDFGKDDVKPEVDWVVKACEVASSLSVDVVRIDAIHQVNPNVAVKAYARLAARCILDVIEKTKDLNVSLGIENHGIIGNQVKFIQEVLNTVKSDRMGLTMDPGNFYWYGYKLNEVYEIIELFAPYVKHTHFKNLSFNKERQQVRRIPGEDYPKTAAPLYGGDIDIKRVVSILKMAGYNGDLTVEDESLGNFPPEQRLGIVKRDVEYLKSSIQPM